MAEATLWAQSGEQTGRVELPAALFGIKPHPGVVHEAVRAYHDSQRQGNASTLTRSEVNASGRKPWRQKGSGRARAGKRNSPIWRGGGIIFGPRPHGFAWQLPRRLRRLAICSALSARADEGVVLVLESLQLPEAKTRQMVQVLRNLGLEDRKTLLVLPALDEAVDRAARNQPRMRVRLARDLTAYDVLDCDRVVVLRAALALLEERAA